MSAARWAARRLGGCAEGRRNATGSSAGETANLKGLRLEDSQLDSLVQIEKVEKRHYLVNAPDMPVLDMPILVDPDGVVIRRVDFNGHYEISSRLHQTEGDFWDECKSFKYLVIFY